jgi:hypothetical protein
LSLQTYYAKYLTSLSSINIVKIEHLLLPNFLLCFLKQKPKNSEKNNKNPKKICTSFPKNLKLKKKEKIAFNI